MKFVKDLASNNILVPHIDRVIAETEWEWTFEHKLKEEDDAWHPSGDCTPSLHDLYMKATGQAAYDSHGAALRKSFMIGHAWHAWLQHLIRVRLEFCGDDDIERRGYEMWGTEEVIEGEGDGIPIEDGKILKAKPFHWATGAGDIAPCEIPGHGPYLVDIKTMKEADFRQQWLPAWAAEKYIAQMQVYMHFFNLERALILCVNKNSPHDFREVIVERNEDLIEAIFAKWKLVSTCVDEGVKPPPDEPFDLPFGPKT